MLSKLEICDNQHNTAKPHSMHALNHGERSRKSSSFAGLEKRSPQLYNNFYRPTLAKNSENPFTRSKSSSSIGQHSSVLSSSLNSEKTDSPVFSASATCSSDTFLKSQELFKGV